jgi:hypothetical protein
VKAAREQLPYLESQVEKIIQKKKDLVNVRLEYAEQDADRDQARRICDAIIELYQGKNWAADLVAKAKRIRAKPEDPLKTNQGSDRPD